MIGGEEGLSGSPSTVPAPSDVKDQSSRPVYVTTGSPMTLWSRWCSDTSDDSVPLLPGVYRPLLRITGNMIWIRTGSWGEFTPTPYLTLKGFRGH